MFQLDPDRYEFYTFNDDGDLVKRLMTMEEIQSIVANGDSEQPTAALAKNPTEIIDNEANIRDIVSNVQKVLHSEIVNNNFTQSLMYNKLETPDTSSSWSSILPAIFGNTGDSISANKVTATNTNTADSILVPQTVHKKPLKNKTSNTPSVIKTTPTPSKTTTNKLTKQKLKPSWPAPSVTTNTPLKASTLTQNTKHTSPTKTKQTINNTFSPISQLPYLKQNATTIIKPTKSVAAANPSTSQKPTTVYFQKLSTQKIALSPSINKSTLSTSNAVTATKKPVAKRPTTINKLPSIAFKTPTTLLASSISTTTHIPFTIDASTKNNQAVETHANLQSSLKKKSGTTTLKPKTTKITTNSAAAKLKENFKTSTVEYVTTSHPTRKTSPVQFGTTIHETPQKINPDAIAVMEPEPENIFDSELSLNQIIESLKDLEGTTIAYPSNYVGSLGIMDVTTYESETIPSFEKFDVESATITNAADNMQGDQKMNSGKTKQKITNNVSYIPQTTLDYNTYPSSTEKYSNTNKHYLNTKSNINSIRFGAIEHKESDDSMILDETTTAQATLSDIVMTTMMDTLLRESFDNVLSQIQNNEPSKTIDSGIETTTYLPLVKANDTKKSIVKPTPFVPIDELDSTAATKPMKYFEAVIKQYEEEKNRTESMNKSPTDPTTMKSIQLMPAKSTKFSEFKIETTTEMVTSTENYSTGMEEHSTTLSSLKLKLDGISEGEISGSEKPSLQEEERITDQESSEFIVIFYRLITHLFSISRQLHIKPSIFLQSYSPILLKLLI